MSLLSVTVGAAGRLLAAVLLLVTVAANLTPSYGSISTAAGAEARTLLQKILPADARALSKAETSLLRGAGLQKISRYLSLPLPGGQPQVATFLDAVEFSGGIRTMTEAWGKPLAKLPSHSNLDAYLSSKSGQ